MNRFQGYFLTAIILLAAILRFYQLGNNPPSLTWDEAAWGYNAYSIGIDGKDEFGKFLPVTYIESFGDYKPPVYMYLDVLPIKLFGLTEFAVRFPSAFFGVLTVFVTYFLITAIFYDSRQRRWLALAGSFVMAISPWHIMLSRAAFEANVATFFIVTGVWLFFLALRKNMWLLFLSALSFILSMNTFNSARIVSPLLIIVLCIVFWKKLFRHRKPLLFSLIIGIILVLPLARFLITPQAATRFREVNIFTDASVVTTSNQEIANDHNVWWSKILHNRRWLYAQSFIQHYFDHFNPGYLFIKGDGNPKFSTQSVGELYLWDIPFFVVGVFWLFKKKEGYWWFIPVWMLLGIIPAATARETPHALRTEAIVPTMQIIVAYGVVIVMERLLSVKHQVLNIKIKDFIFALCFLLLFFNISYFLHGYYYHYAMEYSGEWQYGYKESINYASRVYSKYDHIYVTEELGRPYIYYAFYLKIKPRVFRQQAKVTHDAFGFVDVIQIGKFYFQKNMPDIGPGNNLFINTSSSVPKNAHIKKEFFIKNGNSVLDAYTI